MAKENVNTKITVTETEENGKLLAYHEHETADPYGSVYEEDEEEPEEEPSADDIDLTEDEYKELKNNVQEWNIVRELYEKDPYCFVVFENTEEFGASDPDNVLREDEDDEEWGEYLYGAHLNDGDFVKKFSSGRYLLGTKN